MPRKRTPCMRRRLRRRPACGGSASPRPALISLCNCDHLHQGAPYLVLDPSQEVAQARLGRCPTTDHAVEITRRLALHRKLRQPLEDAAASVLQGAWRQWAQWRREDREEAAAAAAASARGGAGLPSGGALPRGGVTLPVQPSGEAF